MRGVLLRCASVTLVVCVQWTIASIPETDTEKFDERVVELKRTSRWRYGYASQFHGVVLVKARNVPGAPPLVPIDSDDRLSLVMARQLRLRIWKAGFELLFYAALQHWRVNELRRGSLLAA